MKTLGILIAGAVLFSGCGKTYLVPAQYQPYVDRFKAEAKTQGVDSKIDMSQLVVTGQALDKLIGNCHADINGVPMVTMDQDRWNAASDLMKEQGMFHELGHCWLGRGHTIDPFYSKGNPGLTPIANIPLNPCPGVLRPGECDVPGSIMNPKEIDEDKYKAVHDKYMKELFSSVNKGVVGGDN